MKYVKMLGFYFFELLGSIINFLGAAIGVYPSLDLGVSFLLFAEGGRIKTEKDSRVKMREEKHTKAKLLESEAKSDYGKDI